MHTCGEGIDNKIKMGIVAAMCLPYNLLVFYKEETDVLVFVQAR